VQPSAAWGWHLYLPSDQALQIESVRFELHFCFFEARRVTMPCMTCWQREDQRTTFGNGTAFSAG
jgi:hypothetical protein